METSVTVTNSSFQNYPHPDNHSRQTKNTCELTKFGVVTENLNQDGKFIMKRLLGSSITKRQMNTFGQSGDT